MDVVVSIRWNSVSCDANTPLRNTQIVDTCVVFKSWHIRSNAGFVFSCFAIVLLGIFFEWLRSYAKRVDRKILAKTSKGRVRLASSRDGSRERGEDAPKWVSSYRHSVKFITHSLGQVPSHQQGFPSVSVYPLRYHRLYILLPHARVHDIQRA